MRPENRQDWLGVVYGAGLEHGRQQAPGTAMEIAVRHSPAVLDPASSPGGEQRIRVTVVPSAATVSWSLYLRDFGPGPGEAPTTRVWWRLDPGTWQPLGGTRQCVATGRGRVRLDVSLRVDPEAVAAGDVVTPRLRFVAESA